MAVYYEATVVNSAGTSGAQTVVPLDIHQNPFSVSFGLRKVGTGDSTIRMEHTFDNVLARTSGAEVSGRFFRHEDVSAATDTIDGNYAFPVRAIRAFTTTPVSGQSSWVISIIQGAGK